MPSFAPCLHEEADTRIFAHATEAAKGITVRLVTVSVGAIGFMRIRNKYGRTLVNPIFCSADTWS